MLDQYRPILFACSLIVALWAVAITSNPSFPDPLHLSLLIAGAAWLVFGGIISNKERRFVAAIFLLAFKKSLKAKCLSTSNLLLISNICI